MQLLKFELYKIFQQKIIYITFILLIGMSYLSLTTYYDPELVKKTYKEWEGPITEEKIAKANLENTKIQEKAETMQPGETYAEEDMLKMGIYESLNYANNIEMNFDARLKVLENESNYNTELEKAMREEVSVSYFSYHAGPAQIVRFVEFAAFIVTGVMLLIGLSSLYSKEYSSGVDNYIFSSKKGRTNLVWAKIGAALIYTFSIVLIIEVLSASYNLLKLGFAGWGMPIQYIFEYFNSPYAYTMLEYHFIQIGIHLLGACAFALIILFFSSVSKNVLIAFLASGFLFGAPIILYETVRWEWLREVMSFSFIYIMKVQVLFESFKTINLFGYPVLYPFVAVFLMLVISVICVIVLFSVNKNKEVF